LPARELCLPQSLPFRLKSYLSVRPVFFMLVDEIHTGAIHE
jgi:hypothetical protein